MPKPLAITFTLLTFLLPESVSPQNLVPNGSFESYDQCPENGQIKHATHWLSPYFTISPDYYHTCIDSSSSYGVPDNDGGYQWPRTGQGYAGITPFSLYPWDTSNVSNHEYLTTYLEEELKEEAYCASFFVSRGEDYLASSPLGIHFSKDTGFYNYSSYYGPLPQTPQVEYDGTPIQDTLEWNSIHGIFQAEGGEAFITIGNFRDCTETELIPKNVYYSTSYYYIDDVSVVPLKPIDLPQGGDTTIMRGESVPLSRVEDPVADYTWSPSKGLDDPNNVSPMASPQETTTYTVTKTTQCSTTTAEVTVRVEQPPTPPEDQVYVPNVFAPGSEGDKENRVFRVHGGPFGDFHLQVFSRWGELVFETRDPDEAWEGRYGGEPMKAGVYSYQLRATLPGGEEVERSGTVTLLR